NLARDLRGQIRDIELLDFARAALPRNEPLPRGLHAATERRHHAHARDDDASHAHLPTRFDRLPRSRARCNEPSIVPEAVSMAKSAPKALQGAGQTPLSESSNDCGRPFSSSHSFLEI